MYLNCHYLKMYKFAIISIILIVITTNVSSFDDIYGNCGNSLQCVEQNLVKYIDRLDDETIPILGNTLVLEKKNNITENGQNNEDVIERGLRYLTSHELKFRIPAEDGSRSLITEGRARRLKKLLIPLLILLKLKAVIIIPAILAIIAFAAFRGLDTGMLALVIAGATAFKSAIENHSPSSKLIEIVPQISSPWSRQGVDPIAQGYHTVPQIN